MPLNTETLMLFKCTPIGSLLLLPPEQYEHYTEILFSLPPALIDLLISNKTGAYIRGIIKSHSLDPNKAPLLAHCVLKVGMGEIPLPSLMGAISTELKVSNDVAAAIAKELEGDLFVSVTLELNNYLSRVKSQKAQRAEQIARQAGARNVLNLKSQTNIPQPPAIPY